MPLRSWKALDPKVVPDSKPSAFAATGECREWEFRNSTLLLLQACAEQLSANTTASAL
jgi:hypothetical protein